MTAMQRNIAPAYRRRGHPPRFPDPVARSLWQAAGLSRQCRLGAEAEGGARRHHARAIHEEYANVHRGLHFLSNAATQAYEDARESVRRFLNAPSKDQLIFTRNATEAINLVAQSFGGMVIGRGRRDRALDHGAPFQHRALAFPSRAAWRGDQMGADRRGRQFPHRRVREAALAAHQDCRHHPDVECAGHHRSGQGGHSHCPCPRHSGAGRWQPGGGSHAGRRAGPRLRFLRLHRPQDLRADRHRRALRQDGASEAHAALSGRRRDDRRGHARHGHLCRAAASLRGGHAGHRPGDRARRCARLHAAGSVSPA